VSRRPKPFPDLLGREAELETALAALADTGPYEFHAPPGMGKSSLLRHLGHHPQAPGRGRVVYRPGRGQTLWDIAQFLFDALYEYDEERFVPNRPQLARYLHDVTALLLVDDVELDGDDVQALSDVAPACSALVTSTARRVWDGERSTELQGLGEDAGLALFERGLKRSLEDPERAHAVLLWRAVGGSPLRLGQAAELVAAGKRSLADLAADTGSRRSVSRARSPPP
jgi:hypothetical protein